MSGAIDMERAFIAETIGHFIEGQIVLRPDSPGTPVYTRTKTITQRWPVAAPSHVDFVMPTLR